MFILSLVEIVTFEFLKILFMFAYPLGRWEHMPQCKCIEVRGQLAGIGSLLPVCMCSGT